MNEENTEENTEVETLKPAVLAPIAEFEAREFTLTERKTYEAIQAEYDLETHQAEITEFTTRIALQKNDQVETAQKIVNRREEQIGKLLAQDDWDDDELESLLAKLKAARASLEAATLDSLPDTISTTTRQNELYNAFLAVQERVNLAMVRTLAEAKGAKLPPVSELVDLANSADHDLAARIVETGVASDPLSRVLARQTNRAGRRSLAKRKRSNVLN